MTLGGPPLMVVSKSVEPVVASRITMFHGGAGVSWVGNCSDPPHATRSSLAPLHGITTTSWGLMFLTIHCIACGVDAEFPTLPHATIVVKISVADLRRQMPLAISRS